MSPKEYLMLIGKLDLWIKIRSEQLEYLEEKRTAIGGIDYAADRIKVNPAYDQMADRTIDYDSKIEALSKKLKKMVLQHITLRDQITDQIEKIGDNRYENILRLRYLQGMKLTDIATTMHYNYKWLCQLHGKALQAFGRKYAAEIRKQDQTRLFL